jgi:hypothetical protein
MPALLTRMSTPPNFSMREGHHRLDLLGLGHVGVVVGRLHAEFLADVGVQLLDLLGVAEAVEDDVGALFGQRTGDSRGRCPRSSR